MVCCGDVLGKGGDDWACLKYLEAISSESLSSSGRVALILGNHEVMNVAGNMRHVARQGFRDVAVDFGGWRTLDEARAKRREVFAPGGPGALLLHDLCGNEPVARIVGDTLFCHGGIHDTFLDKYRRPGETYRRALRRLNDEACAWLAGRNPMPASLEGDFSPAWLAAYSFPPGAEPEPADCASARRVLRLLDCKRMVVGHTPQLDVGCNAACGGTVLRIDTGASRVYGGSKEAVELRRGVEPTVHSAAVRLGF